MAEALREPGMIHLKAMAFVTRDGKLLVQKGFDPVKGQVFFRLPGGGVHFQETAHDCILRELREELESDTKNIVSRGVVENIFTYKGIPGHEVIFLFSVDLVREVLYERDAFPMADNPSITLTWIPVADVLSGAATLYPEVLWHDYLV